MRRFVYLLTVIVAFATQLHAQELAPPVNLTAAEYFFDSDPGAGNGIPLALSGADRVTLSNVEIDVDDLSSGFHVLYVRFQDADGIWGVPARQLFYKPEEIVENPVTKAELFLDESVPFDQGISIPINSGDQISATFELDLETTNLAPGFHRAFVRLQDASGAWGNYQSQLFYLPEVRSIAVVDGAEYFYDELGEPGTGTPLTANGSPETGLVQLNNVEIDAPEATGFHPFYVRFRDSENTWGMPARYTTYQPEPRNQPEITAVEYFLEENPAFGDGTVVEFDTPSTSVNQAIDIPVSALKTGFNRLFVRLKDSENIWGNYSSQLIFIPKSKKDLPKIIDMEYFLSASTAPQPGNGFDIEALSSTGLFDSVSVSGKALVTLTQPIGSQAVYVRAKDATEQWGVPVPAAITLAVQRDFQGQVYSDEKFVTDGTVNLYQDGSWIASTAIDDYGLFTFQNLQPGSYEARFNQSMETKLGVEIQDIGTTGVKTMSSAAQELINADMTIFKPLHVIATKPNPYDNRIKSTDNIELSFSGKFIPASISTSTIHLVSDLRGNLDYQLSLQSNDSVLVLNPAMNLLTNEKITLLVDATYQSTDGTEVMPYTTHFRVQVTGGGTDSWEGSYVSTGVSNFSHMTHADFDGDTDVDLAVLSFTPNQVTFYLNDGNGDFIQGSSLSVSSVNSGNNSYIFAGDYNLDGKMDLGVYQLSGFNSEKDGLITLFKQNENGVFAQEFTLGVRTTTTAYEPVIGFYQLDYDAYPEIVLLTGGQTQGVVVFHNKNGTFNDDTALEGYVSIIPHYSNNLAVGDFTGDGLTDFLVGNTYTTQTDYFYIGSDNTYASLMGNQRTFNKNTGNQSPYRYLADDFNRDGKLDLVSFVYNNLMFYSDQADEANYLGTRSVQNHTPRYNVKDNFAIGDLNADGKLDVLSVQENTSSFALFYVSQDVFRYQGSFFNEPRNEVRSPKLIDLNKDGVLDLLYISRGNTADYSITTQINKSVPTNTAPIVASKPNDVDIFTSTDSMLISVANTFNDADGDDLILTLSNSNTEVVRAELFGNELALYPISIGSAQISLTADDDRGGIVSTQFVAYVNAPDNFTPRLASPISNIETRIADDSTTIDLTSVFDDPDAGDTLTFTTTNPNPSVARVFIYNNTTLVIAPVDLGSITIKVTATDGKATAQNTFEVRVGPRENRSPVVTAVIPDQRINLGDTPLELNPAEYFSDPDADVLTYQIVADNPSIAAGSYNASTNRILITGSQAGTTRLTVTAKDAGEKSISSSFELFVNAKPKKIGFITPLILVLGGNAATFQLNQLFSDENGETLSYTAISGNPSIANVSINSGQKTLTITAFGEGETAISVIARDMDTQSSPLAINVNVKTESFAAQTSNSNASAYPNGITVKNWTLLSIPGTGVNTTPATLFEGIIPGNDFRVYDLNSNGEYFDVSSEAGPVFSAGKALWFKTKGLDQAFTLQTGTGKRIRSRSYQIPVNHWKFISNPFETEASWSSSNAELKIWKFSANSQSWSRVQNTEKLKPWGGYAAFSATGGFVTLSLDEVVADLGKWPPQKSHVEDEIQLSSELWIGDAVLMMENRSSAKKGYDQFDEPLLPSTPDAKVASPYFIVDQFALSKDVQPTLNNEQDFANTYRNLVIPSGNKSVHWVADAILEDFVLALVNEDTYRIIEPGDSITFSDRSKERRFKIYIGTREQIEKHVLPESPYLFNNYPNPFNPTTVLRFAITKPAHVRLEVYDILGRKVATVVNQSMQAGFHQTQFNAINLASGMYLYRLTIDNRVIEVKKMTLLK